MATATHFTVGDIGAIIKEKYLPALEHQLNVSPSAFFEKVRKAPLTGGSTMITAAPYGLVGGFGFGAEGVHTPEAAHQNYLRFSAEAVDMYCNIEFSEKLRRLGGSDSGVIIDAIDGEIQGAYEAARWNIGRALFGDGSGKLCTTTSSFSTSTVPVSDTKNLKVGLMVDIYAGAETEPAIARTRILAIDNAAKNITISTTPSASVAAGFITVQNSYHRELTGLWAIMNPSNQYLYGVDRQAYPFMFPTQLSAGHKLDDYLLATAMDKAERDHNTQIDMYLMGDGAYRAYFAFMKNSHVHVVENLSYAGGAAGFRVQSGAHIVEIVHEPFVPSDECWGVCTKDFVFYQTGWSFADYQSSVFQLRDNTSEYRALLSNYGNLICRNPGGCIRITDCDIESGIPTSLSVTGTGSATSSSLAAGSSLQLHVTAAPAGSDASVNWMSTDPAVATVTPFGLATVSAAATSQQKVRIYAISKGNADVYGYHQITVS